MLQGRKVRSREGINQSDKLSSNIDPAWRTAYKSIARVLLSSYHPASEMTETF